MNLLPSSFIINFIALAALQGCLLLPQIALAELSADEANNLSSLSEQGDSNAVEKLRQAAKDGDSRGQMSFGFILFQGFGVQKDEKEAVKWFRLAAEQGNAAAIANLAAGYEIGFGELPKYPVMGLALYEVSASKGNEWAKGNGNALANELTEEQLNHARALTPRLKNSNSLLTEIDSYIKEAIDDKKLDVASSDPFKPIWTDPNTGLTWTVCEYGSKLIRLGKITKCSMDDEDGGKSIRLRWFDAINESGRINFEGHSDWRIPTISEILTVYKCRKSNWEYEKKSNPNAEIWHSLVKYDDGFHCPSEIGGVGMFIDKIQKRGGFSVWTSSPALQYGYSTYSEYAKNEEIEGKPRLYIDYNGIKYNGTNIEETASFILVRGGDSSDEWLSAVKDAEVVSKFFLDNENKVNAKIAESKAEAAEARAQEAEANRIKTQQYESETKKLRASVKPGDKIAQGLVIEVKDSLVYVQTYKRVCTMYRPDISPFSGQHECNSLSWKIEPGENVWFNRSDILPVTQ